MSSTAPPPRGGGGAAGGPEGKFSAVAGAGRRRRPWRGNCRRDPRGDGGAADDVADDDDDAEDDGGGGGEPESVDVGAGPAQGRGAARAGAVPQDLVESGPPHSRRRRPPLRPTLPPAPTISGPPEEASKHVVSVDFRDAGINPGGLCTSTPWVLTSPLIIPSHRPDRRVPGVGVRNNYWRK